MTEQTPTSPGTDTTIRASDDHPGRTPDEAPGAGDTTTGEPGFTEPAADRPPTAEEERVAEQVAAEVDLDEVGEHYREAMETGADVRGEGQIEP